MTVLNEYKSYIDKGEIPYFWNTSNNLIGAVNPKYLENMSNRLKVVINDIEKKKEEPLTIAKYLCKQFFSFCLLRYKHICCSSNWCRAYYPYGKSNENIEF